MKTKPLSLLSVALAILLCSVINAQNSVQQQVDQLFSGLNNLNSPGAAIAIVKDGKVIYEKGYGCANLEYDIPVSSSTVFHIASVSKQVTAFAVLLLEQDGKLSYDDDIRKYLPQIPDFGEKITLRQLANHTSGFRDQWNLLMMAGWRLDDVITTDQIMNLICRQKELNNNPGDAYLYSNTGYTLLAEVVEKVSGKSFTDFTQERIFAPLRMTNTLFYDDHEKIVKNRAYSYNNDGKQYKKSNLNYSNVGATSLLTTVDDMAKWALNFENPVVGTPALMQKMNKRGILNNGDTITYALGQDVSMYKGLKFISHGGADAGYRSFFGRFPDQHFSVIVFSNNGQFDPAGTAMAVADLYLRDFFIPEKPMPQQAVAVLTGSKVFNTDPAVLQSYCGNFQLRPGYDINISVNNSNLFVEAHDVGKQMLTQLSNTQFSLPQMNALVTFVPDVNGKVNNMEIELNGQKMTAHRIASMDLSSVNLADYSGDYYSPELNTIYTFTLRENKLMVGHQRMNDFELTPIWKDQFSTQGWFFNTVDFIRNSNNKITGCKISSGRSKAILFEKVK